MAAGVAPSVIAAIESGSRRPGLELFDSIVRAVGHRIVVCEFVADAAATIVGGTVGGVVGGTVGGVVETDDAHDAIRDRRGRRFPAHLEWEGKPVYPSIGRWWWGWHRIAKRSDELVPDHVYWQRPREARGPIREHPWFGEFRSRSGCFGAADAPCANCSYVCRFRPETPEDGSVAPE